MSIRQQLEGDSKDFFLTKNLLTISLNKRLIAWGEISLLSSTKQEKSDQKQKYIKKINKKNNKETRNTSHSLATCSWTILLCLVGLKKRKRCSQITRSWTLRKNNSELRFEMPKIVRLWILNDILAYLCWLSSHKIQASLDLSPIHLSLHLINLPKNVSYPFLNPLLWIYPFAIQQLERSSSKCKISASKRDY